MGTAAAATVAGNLGLALTLGSIATMLTPVPKQFDPGIRQTLVAALLFLALQNVSQEGIPVPVVYGEMIVGSVVLSTGLVADFEINNPNPL